jgi:hypothetical protein
MTDTRNYTYEITRYWQAADAYRRWIAAAARKTPALERAALLAMAGQDLSTGPAAVAVADHRHMAREVKDILLSPPWQEALGAAARHGDPVESRRAAWIIGQAARDDTPPEGFAVRVAVPDPAPDGRFAAIETRVLIDGVPVISAAFDKGPAEDPLYLLDRGLLRATEDPHEVRLAEAYCTEGCCGALYVTIAREGSEVAWRNWRSSMKGDPPGDMRFDAIAYDREVKRAEQDFTWEWPARTVSRLARGELRADASILGRWDCSPGWTTAWLREFDAVRISFDYPHRPPGTRNVEDPHVQFGLVIDVPAGEAPADTAERIIESLRSTDPKTSAEVIGGTKDGPERLGLTRRDPVRWRARDRWA